LERTTLWVFGVSLALPGSPKLCIQNPKGVLERVIPFPFKKTFGFSKKPLFPKDPKDLLELPNFVQKKTKGFF